MPKMKTHKASAKRFRITGTGKLKRGKAFKSHILTKKSSKPPATLGKPGTIISLMSTTKNPLMASVKKIPQVVVLYFLK